jgi:hypothetical protein
MAALVVSWRLETASQFIRIRYGTRMRRNAARRDVASNVSTGGIAGPSFSFLGAGYYFVGRCWEDEFYVAGGVGF